MPVFSKPLVLAVTAASQRELFQAPIAGRPQAFLAPAQPALVPMVSAPVDVMYPPATGFSEQVYYVEEAAAPDAQSSWMGWSAIAAAAVAGVAIGRATAEQPAQGTVSDQLLEGMAEQQELAMIQKLATLSVGGQEAAFDGKAYAENMPGVLAPMGFFDPLGFCSADDITEGKIKFYREVELKHGRVGMLAALGFVVGENFHPLFGGDIDVPAFLAFQQTPLQTFWPAVVFAIAIPEIFSVFTFETPALFSGALEKKAGDPWSIRDDHVAGDLGFDPLGLKPTDPAELKEMQTKELQNGRLAMIAAAGMIAQELASSQKLFMLSVSGTEAPAAPATTSRRELIARVAATAPLVAAALPAFAAEVGAGLQPNKRTEEVAGGGGATGGEGFSLVSTKGAAASAGRGGGQIPTIRAAGTWNDPAHPGCTRKIKLAGKTAFITGADEDGKKWEVRGLIQGDSLVIDFTPKGGPKDVEAKYVIGKGLVFPDGNVWSKA